MHSARAGLSPARALCTPFWRLQNDERVAETKKRWAAERFVGREAERRAWCRDRVTVKQGAASCGGSRATQGGVTPPAARYSGSRAVRNSSRLRAPLSGLSSSRRCLATQKGIGHWLSLPRAVYTHGKSQFCNFAQSFEILGCELRSLCASTWRKRSSSTPKFFATSVTAAVASRGWSRSRAAREPRQLGAELEVPRASRREPRANRCIV